MSRSVPLTPAAVEEQLLLALKRMEALVEECAEIGFRAACAEAAYKSEYAKARIAARMAEGKVTVDAVDDAAAVACEKLHSEYLVADAELRSCREALNAVRSRIDALRTLGAGLRSVT